MTKKSRFGKKKYIYIYVYNKYLYSWVRWNANLRVDTIYLKFL